VAALVQSILEPQQAEPLITPGDTSGLPQHAAALRRALVALPVAAELAPELRLELQALIDAAQAVLART
jgi:hypothetical protein